MFVATHNGAGSHGMAAYAYNSPNRNVYRERNWLRIRKSPHFWLK
jgi:hypothetical protein